jgi:tetratricopeptide (TPR) repeat protein
MSRGKTSDVARRLYERGRQAIHDGDFEEAVQLLTRSSQADPHYKTLELLGESLQKLGRYRESVVPLAAATALSRHHRAPALLSRSLLEAGKREDARAAAWRVIEVDIGNKAARAVLQETADIAHLDG